MSRLSGAFVISVVLAWSTGFVVAQQPSASLSTDLHPDISGIWNRIDTAGAGSWGGLASTYPAAQLLPEYAAKLPAEAFQGLGTPPPGWKPPVYDINNQAPTPTRCAVGGGGFNAGNGGYNIDSQGMSLMASNDEVLMLRDGQQGGRRIRLDGRGFPDPSRMNGIFSIGKWEGDNLVVITRGFGSALVQYGRGWTEPSTELTETFSLQPGGKRMIITYTFSDPKVYVKPHTYQLPFERLPVNQYVFESWCDSKEWIDWNRQQQATGAPAAGRGGNGRGAATPAPAGRQ